MSQRMENKASGGTVYGRGAQWHVAGQPEREDERNQLE
jgi:hypothetical protein